MALFLGEMSNVLPLGRAGRDELYLLSSSMMSSSVRCRPYESMLSDTVRLRVARAEHWNMLILLVIEITTAKCPYMLSYLWVCMHCFNGVDLSN